MKDCFWHQFAQQPMIFCEERLCGPVAEPANTWTNIGYLAIAIAVARGRSRVDPDVRRLFTVSMITLFLFSTLFHATGTVFGKMADVSAMFFFSAGVVALSLQKTYQWGSQKTYLSFFCLLLPSLAFLFIFRFGNVVFFSHLLLAIILEFRLKRLKMGYLRWSLVAFALAMVTWVLDVKRLFCDPHNHVINGHGLWHLLAALAIWLLYKAYVHTENNWT